MTILTVDHVNKLIRFQMFLGGKVNWKYLQQWLKS